jgi:DNA repair exonuclease SbcCD ATPase subunit
MTIRIIKGTTEYEGVPYYARTSQDVIEGIADKEGRRLIDLGYAEIIPDPPKQPLGIFPESPEKIRNKISELEAKLAEAEKEQETLLNDDLQDVAGITKKLDTASSRVSSLRALIQRQQAKLKRAETNKEIEREKAAVKNLEEATKEHKAEAKKVLNGILSALAALEASVEALYELSRCIGSNYAAAGGDKWHCPMNNALEFPKIWKDDFDKIKSYVKLDLSRLDLMAERMPQGLQGAFNAKRHKTAEQLNAELLERENMGVKNGE